MESTADLLITNQRSMGVFQRPVPVGDTNLLENIWERPMA